jgi:hypothetical protein
MQRNEQMVDTLDAVGKRLLDAVLAFKLPPEYLPEVSARPGGADTWAAVA